MVTDWLEKNYNVKKFGPPTWKSLVEAVGHRAGGANMALAEKIAKSHKAEGTSSRYIHVYTTPSQVSDFRRMQYSKIMNYLEA